jgi:hypothetical protein
MASRDFVRAVRHAIDALPTIPADPDVDAAVEALAKRHEPTRGKRLLRRV